MAVYLGPGAVGARVRDDMGREYDLPVDVAQQSFPDAFPEMPQPGIDPGTSFADAMNVPQEAPPPGYEPPPWEALGEQPNSLGADIALSAPSLPPEAANPQVAPGAPVQSQAPQRSSQGYSMSISVPVQRSKLGIEYIDSQNLPSFDQEKDLYVDGAIKESEAIGAQGAAEAELNQVMTGEGGLYDQQIDHQRETTRQMANLQTQHQHVREEAERKVEQAWNDVPSMEPGRVWRNSDSFTRAAGVIAAGMQGFLNPGGESQALNMMQQVIENDLRSQEADIRTAKDQAQAEERGYDRTVTRLNSREAELSMKRAAMYKTLEMEVAKKQAAAQSKFTQAKLAGIRAGLQKSSASWLMNAKQQETSTMMQAVGQNNSARIGEAGVRNAQASLALRRQEMNDRRNANNGPEDPRAGLVAVGKSPSNETIYVPKHLMNDATKKEIDKTLARWTTNTEVSDIVRDMQESTVRLGRALRINPADADARKEYAHLKARFVRAMRSEVGANLPEGEAERVIAMAPTPEQLLTSPDKHFNLMGSFIKSLETDTNRMMNQRGFVVEKANQETGQPEFHSVGRGTSGPLHDDFVAYEQQKDAVLMPAKRAVDQLAGAVASYDRAEGEAGKESRLNAIGGKVNAIVKEIEEGGLTPADHPELYKQITETLSKLPPEARGSFMVTSPEGWPRHIGDPVEYFEGEMANEAEKEMNIQSAIDEMRDVFPPPIQRAPHSIREKYGDEVADEAHSRMKFPNNR